MEPKQVEKKTILCRTLAGIKNLPFSLECLSSFIENSYHDIQLELFDDGTLKETDIAHVESTLKNCTVITKAKRTPIILDKLLKHPKCYEFRNINVLGLKLFDIMLYDENDFFYLDTDVYIIKKFILPEFKDYPILMKDNVNGYLFKPFEFVKVGTPISPFINSGFLYFPSTVFDLDFIEKVLTEHYINGLITHFWAEQTLWAFLTANAKNGCYFNPEQIVLATHKLNLGADTIAVHLVSPTRYHFENVKKIAAERKKDNTTYEQITVVKIDKHLTKFAYTYRFGVSKLRAALRRISK